MKKNFLVNCFIFAIIFSCAAFPAHHLLANQTQDREHQRILENVTVTNIEVPVRVLYKGKPVAGLTAEDFEIFENKRRVPINGFYVKRKKISMITPGEVKPQRTFVLAFNITKYNHHFARALDHLFDNVLRSTDRLLIFTNGKSREYPRIRDKQTVKAQLIADLKVESQKVNERLIRYVKLLESYVDSNRIKVFWSDRDTSRKPFVELVFFLQKYQRTWNEYKRQFLKPKLDHFYYFARYLENIKTEKWVLNFYQHEVFPKIRPNSQLMERMRILSIALMAISDPYKNSLGRLVDKMLLNLSIDTDLGSTIPNQEISKLFHKVGATFHSFFISSPEFSTREDFEYRQLSSDIEKVLKEITQITGGRNIASNNLVKSLNTVSEIEDIYYVLTYVPQAPKRSGKLKIKVKNKGKRYKVLYDNNFRPAPLEEYLAKLEEKIETPGIKINDFSFRRKVLAFTVKNFLMKMKASEEDEKTGKVGKMKLRIRLTDKDNNSLFDQVKVLTARETEMKISLAAFKTIKEGEYNLLIDAVDMFTGKEANIYKNIMVR